MWPRNRNCWGYFDTQEEAEKLLIEHWHVMHEYWNNTAVIEFNPQGLTREMSYRQIKKQFPRKWFKIRQDSDFNEGGNLEVIGEPSCFRNTGYLSF
jgi:hemolysin-activating ACP:hemolysin acyltransferase